MGFPLNDKDPLGILGTPPQKKQQDPLGILAPSKKKEKAGVPPLPSDSDGLLNFFGNLPKKSQAEINKQLNTPKSSDVITASGAAPKKEKPFTEVPLDESEQKTVKYFETRNILDKIPIAEHGKENDYATGVYSDNLANFSIKKYAAENPDFARQLKDTHISLDDPSLFYRIGSGKRGQIFNEFLNDEHVKNFIANERPDLIPAYEKSTETLLTNNRDFGINVVANKVSQAVQETGYNNIDPIFNFYGKGHKEFADIMAKSVLSPTELEIWNKDIKNNQEDYMDAPSFFEGVASGIKDVGEGMKSTFTSMFNSKDENIREQWDKEASNVSANPKGGYKVIRDMGHATGFVMTMVAANEVGAGAGLSPMMAQRIMVGTTFFGNELKEGQMKYDNPVKAWTSAVLNTGAYVALSDIFPSSKINNLINRAKPELENITKQLTEGAITKETAINEATNTYKKIIDIGKSVLVQDVKTSGELTAAAAGKQALDTALGLDEKTYEKYHPKGELMDTFKQMFLSNLPIAGLAGYGEVKRKIGENKGVQETPEFTKSEQPKEETPITEEQKTELPIEEKKSTTVLTPEEVKQSQKEIIPLKKEETAQEKIEPQKEFDDFKNHVLETIQQVKDNSFDFRISSSLSYKEREQAIRNIKEGKDTKAAQTLQREIKEMYDNGYIELNTAAGGLSQKVGIPIKEYMAEINRMSEIKDVDELNNLLAEDSFRTFEDAITHELQERPTEGTISETVPRAEGKSIKETPSGRSPQEPNREAQQKEIEPPKEPPRGGELVVEDKESMGGITHEATQETTRKAGLPDYEGHEPVTHEERIAKAKQDIEANPNIANEIMDKVEKGGNVSPQDNAVLAVYKGALDKELEGNPSKELYDRISRLAKVLNPEGTYAGQLLESRKLIDYNEENLSNFLLQKEASQGTPLSEPQIKSESLKYEELKKAKDELQQQLDKEREQHAKDIAELGLNKARAKASKASKKSHEDYVAERKNSLDAAREALKKIREQPQASIIPGARELVAIAPHVKEYLHSLANEGIDKLETAIAQIHAEFKDVLDGLTQRNVLDILAGEHDTQKEQTRNEKANSVRLFQREAKLIKELEMARRGEQLAREESKKTVFNRRINELKEKIKEVRRLNKQSEKEVPTETELLSKHIDALTKKAAKLSEDIRTKKYLEEKPKSKPFAKSRKAQILEDKVIDLENKIRHERSADEYNKRGKDRKIFDKVMEVLGIRRLVQSAVDISVPFRQGATLISPRRIDIWLKGFQANLQSVFSPTKFERIMRTIRQDPMYHDMVKDRVVFNDLGSADPNLHNEDFRKSFIYKVPIISEPLKASNRSADAFLNVARYEMYKKMRENLEKKGLTRESDPEAFKYIGNWVMSMTGRGRMTNMLENSVAHTVLGNTFYGARLMASRFNLLNPVTYFDPRIPKAAKVEAMKDMASFTVTMMATGLALAAAGGKISLNPDDSDFLQVRFGDKVYDISGGLANYVRTFLRIVKAGYTKATGTKQEGKKATDKAGQSVLNFFRNKLSPNTAYAVDAFFGKPYGREFDPVDVTRIYPMYTDDALKALKEEGPISIATVLLPNIVGIGYGSYASKGQIDTGGGAGASGNFNKSSNKQPKNK